MKQFNKYPILQSPYQGDEGGVQGLKYPEILEKQFVTLMVGKPNSGKTNLIYQLISDEQFYRNKFNKVIFFSPSGFSGVDFEPDDWSREINMDWFSAQVLKLQNIPKCNMLVVIDDLVLQLSKHKDMLQLMFNRRHLMDNLTVSFLITTQKLTQCPPAIRAIVTNLMVFPVTNAEWAIIEKEYVTDNTKEIRDLRNRLKLHEFIYIRLSPFLVCHNFRPFNSPTHLLISGQLTNQQVQTLSQHPTLEEIRKPLVPTPKSSVHLVSADVGGSMQAPQLSPGFIRHKPEPKQVSTLPYKGQVTPKSELQQQNNFLKK